MCSRRPPERFLEKHHLVPRSRKGKVTERICCDCHGMLHHYFSVKQLENELSTMDAILANPDVRDWLRWIRKRPGQFGFTRREPKGRKRWK